jgi:hypothetical protein
MNDAIRQSMARLPKWVQPFLTWLTSRALPGQRPLFDNTPGTQIAGGFLMLFGGAAISTMAVTLGHAWLLMLPVGWTVTVAGGRYLQTNILHQAAHGRLTGRRWLDRFVAGLASASTLIATLDQYQAAHMDHHRPGTFATIHDPDFQFFRKLGLEPGMPLAALRRRTARVLTSVRAHGLYLKARVSANFLESPPSHRLLAAVVQIAIGSAAVAAGGWLAWLLAWVVAVGPLFQVSGLLQYLSEHVWLLARQPGETRVMHLNRLTIARFTGEMAPDGGRPGLRPLMLWTKWWSRMLTYHLFVRVFVLQGPLGVHDFHHRDPLNRQWPNAVYERQRQVDSGERQYEDYHGVWGLLTALDLSLRAMSAFPELPPSAIDPTDETSTYRLM